MSDIGEEVIRSFSCLALKKLNAMLKRDDFVSIASVNENGVTVQYEESIQHIDRFGRVHNN